MLQCLVFVPFGPPMWSRFNPRQNHFAKCGGSLPQRLFPHILPFRVLLPSRFIFGGKASRNVLIRIAQNQTGNFPPPKVYHSQSLTWSNALCSVPHIGFSLFPLGRVLSTPC